MTEVYLLFIQSVLPCFTHFNQFLQREEPLIHILQPQLTRMLKNILGKFVKPEVIAKSMKGVYFQWTTTKFKAMWMILP